MIQMGVRRSRRFNATNKASITTCYEKFLLILLYYSLMIIKLLVSFYLYTYSMDIIFKYLNLIIIFLSIYQSIIYLFMYVQIGIHGEHGGDPLSIHFFDRIGLDYITCHPYRIPIAKVAAAQAHIEETASKLILLLSYY